MQISTSTRYGNGLCSFGPVIMWLLLFLHLDQCVSVGSAVITTLSMTFNTSINASENMILVTTTRTSSEGITIGEGMTTTGEGMITTTSSVGMTTTTTTAILTSATTTTTPSTTPAASISSTRLDMNISTTTTTTSNVKVITTLCATSGVSCTTTATTSSGDELSTAAVVGITAAVTFLVTSLITYIYTSMYYRRSMINFVKESRTDLRRIVAQSPCALLRANKLVDPAVCAAIKMNANPAYVTHSDASIKVNTDTAYAVTTIKT